MRMAALLLAAATAPCAALAQETQKGPAVFSPLPERAVCQGEAGYSAGFDGRRTFLYRPEWLRAQKARLAADPAATAALRSRAEAALAHTVSTPTDKTRAPPSGDKHDYYSIGPYWWPDPSKRGGEPYVRRDGRVNPERDTDAFDLRRFETLSDDVETLSLAAWHLDDRRYAERAGVLIRAWFLDPATRMNPNLDFAQAVPGRSDGRAEGVIDASRFQPIVEGAGLLGDALTEKERAGLQDWFGELVGWMATSPNGRAERAKTNNHGVVYDLLVTHFALFAGQEAVARHVLGEFGTRRMAAQLAADGSLPKELERTRSWHYSHLATGAMARESQLAECVGIDLWHWRGPDGLGLARALAYLAPYQGRMDDWPVEDIDLADPERRVRAAREAQETFRIAAWGTGDPAYGALAERVPVPDDQTTDLWLAPYPPAAKRE